MLFPNAHAKQSEKYQHTYHTGIIYHGTLLLFPVAAGHTLKTVKTESIKHNSNKSNCDFRKTKVHLHPEKERQRLDGDTES